MHNKMSEHEIKMLQKKDSRDQNILYLYITRNRTKRSITEQFDLPKNYVIMLVRKNADYRERKAPPLFLVSSKMEPYYKDEMEYGTRATSNKRVDQLIDMYN